MPVERCRYCKGAKAKVDIDQKSKEIRKEVCIYCKGQGYIFKKLEGGEKNGILEKSTSDSASTST